MTNTIQANSAIREFENYLTETCPHLYEDIRIEIAKMYLVHEYKRLFIGDKSQDFWEQFSESVAHIEDSPSVRAYGNTSLIRKFWDLVASVVYFRWHPGLLSLLTSTNCEWSLQSIKISEIQLSDALAP